MSSYWEHFVVTEIYHGFDVSKLIENQLGMEKKEEEKKINHQLMHIAFAIKW